MVLLSLSNKTPGLYLETREGTKNDAGGGGGEGGGICFKLLFRNSPKGVEGKNI